MIIIILYLGLVIFQRISNNSSVFGYRFFTIATGSMKPVYNVNDVIVVKDVDNKSLKIGDDIAYLGNRGDVKDKLVTHRIIDKTENNGVVTYQTQGVANANADPSISFDQIYGKVTGKLFFINLLNHLVKNQYGFFFLIFVPLVLVLFLEIADTVIDIKVDKNKLKEKIKDEDEVI